MAEAKRQREKPAKREQSKNLWTGVRILSETDTPSFLKQPGGPRSWEVTDDAES